MTTEKNARQRLSDAIVDEKKQALALVLDVYGTLTAKMQAYQMGTGPAPTNDEFVRWRSAVEHCVKLRELYIKVDGET
jgi:hypothetical protein